MQHHPPGVYVAEPILANARSTRKKLGDLSFFEHLNAAGGEAGKGWGKLGAAWDAKSFDEAAAATHG